MQPGSRAPVRKLADGPGVEPIERERERRISSLFHGRVIAAQPGRLGPRGGYLCDPVQLEGRLDHCVRLLQRCECVRVAASRSHEPERHQGPGARELRAPWIAQH